MQQGRARPVRWAVLLVASLLLHLLAFQWASGRLGLPSPRKDDPPAVTAVLLPPPPPAPVVQPKPRPPAPKPKPKPRKRPQPPPEPVIAPPPEPAVSPLAGMEAPGSSVENAAEVELAPSDTAASAVGTPGVATPGVATPGVATPVAEAPAAPEQKPYKTSPPPSAELEYDVQALREGQQWYGSGRFRWESAAGSYSITGEASIWLLFKITVLNFRSEGRINDVGIAPVLYSEKPWRKSATNTHFQHDKGLISFSASTATYPYHGGEQDRASIAWQLASIGRGDPAQFAPGTELDITVAGARDADSWRIRVAGEEETDTPYGRFATWHVVRVPRAGSHDQQIDIWLAPQREWYPVRVRYTYANGDYLDLSLSELTPGGAAASH